MAYKHVPNTVLPAENELLEEEAICEDDCQTPNEPGRISVGGERTATPVEIHSPPATVARRRMRVELLKFESTKSVEQ
jgi:hypothetical protein